MSRLEHALIFAVLCGDALPPKKMPGSAGPCHRAGGINRQMQRCRTCASSSFFTDAPSAHFKRFRTAASIAPGFKRYLWALAPGEYGAQAHNLH